MKKKITKEQLQNILNKIPAQFRKKIIAAAKQGKKVTLKITKTKGGLKSPYQNK
ncbi:MAG: hypothetical protein LR005_02020 [Candidatus Pacebacteria bacterium]|nr:hypothetical protein [Candidatus Paceibacterota bacterium]